MKKLLCLALVLIFTLVSCGTKTVEFQSVKDVVSKVTFRDLTYEPDLDVTLSQYNITDGIAEYYRITSGTGATAEEITVFKASDSSKIADIVKKCEERKASVGEMYQTYKPDEMPMIEDAQIFSKGDYVIYICVDNSEEIFKQLEQLFK